MSIIKCRYCKKELTISHGNRKYHDACAYQSKKLRSKWQYAKNLGKANPYWKNDKILKEFYYTYGENVEIDPWLLENSGFDFNLCQEETIKNGIKVFIMDKFSFTLLKNEKIIIWKI